jgi:hypothetical protein
MGKQSVATGSTGSTGAIGSTGVPDPSDAGRTAGVVSSRRARHPA